MLWWPYTAPDIEKRSNVRRGHVVATITPCMLASEMSTYTCLYDGCCLQLSRSAKWNWSWNALNTIAYTVTQSLYTCTCRSYTLVTRSLYMRTYRSHTLVGHTHLLHRQYTCGLIGHTHLLHGHYTSALVGHTHLLHGHYTRLLVSQTYVFCAASCGVPEPLQRGNCKGNNDKRVCISIWQWFGIQNYIYYFFGSSRPVNNIFISKNILFWGWPSHFFGFKQNTGTQVSCKTFMNLVRQLDDGQKAMESMSAPVLPL